MTTDTLRWEWRTFADSFGALETRLRRHPDEVRRTSEIYIVSARSNANTKIRNGLVDVKILQRVEARGLELWQPAFKSPFPLPAEAVGLLFREWGLPAQAVPPIHAIDELRALLALHPALTVVDIVKQRHPGTIDGCIVEIADLMFDGSPIRTVAVEMEDPDRVWRTVVSLGLSANANVNYVTAIKQFLAGRSQRTLQRQEARHE